METTGKRIPSLAFIVTVLTGSFFTIFSVLESIGGFLKRPMDLTEGVGGLMQIAVFGVPFLVTAWLLWVRPKIGSIILMLAGFAFAVWMYLDWARPEQLSDWMIPSLLVMLPIILGVYTLIRESLKSKTA